MLNSPVNTNQLRIGGVVLVTVLVGGLLVVIVRHCQPVSYFLHGARQELLQGKSPVQAAIEQSLTEYESLHAVVWNTKMEQLRALQEKTPAFYAADAKAANNCERCRQRQDLQNWLESRAQLLSSWHDELWIDLEKQQIDQMKSDLALIAVCEHGN